MCSVLLRVSKSIESHHHQFLFQYLKEATISTPTPAPSSLPQTKDPQVFWSPLKVFSPLVSLDCTSDAHNRALPSRRGLRRVEKSKK